MINDELTNGGEIVIYHPDESIRLEVRLEQETVWLSQMQMAELFKVNVPAVNKHVKNIYDEGELVRESTISILETVRKEGSRTVKRKVEYYNLDVIISVGYRIKSQVGTRFRSISSSKPTCRRRSRTTDGSSSTTASAKSLFKISCFTVV